MLLISKIQIVSDQYKYNVLRFKFKVAFSVFYIIVSVEDLTDFLKSSLTFRNLINNTSLKGSVQNRSSL